MNRFVQFAFSLAVMGCSLAPRSAAIRTAASAERVPATYDSYALVRAEHVPEPYRRLDFQDQEQGKLARMARDVLVDEGWAEVPVEEADVLLYLAVGKRFAEDESNVNASASFGPFTAASDDTVTLDAFDADTGDHLWHGRAPFRAQSDEVVVAERELESLLAALPSQWRAGADDSYVSPTTEDTDPDPSTAVDVSDRETAAEPSHTEADGVAPVDEFDEFDEFGGEDGTASPAPPPPPSSTDSSGEFDGEFDDEFGDEF